MIFRVANRNVLNKDLILVRRVSPDDNPICPSDKNKIPIEIVFRNIGKIATDSIHLAFRVNNNSWIRETLVKKLNLDDTLNYTFTQLMQVPDTGLAVLTIAIGQNNEQNTLNDTLKTTFNPRREYPVPFIERFETSVFPPKDWPTGDFYYSLYTLKKKTDVIGRNGQASSAIYFDDGGASFINITSAPINLKGVSDPYLAFDVAYRALDRYSFLSVQVSTDCGITFLPIYYKSADSLMTNDNIPYSGPTAANHWRRDSVSLLPYKNKDVMLRFAGLNSSSSQPFYLDNIEVFNRPTPAKDAAITNVLYPVSGVFCPVGKTDLPLQIVVSNTGLSKLDTFIISYKINNTPSVADTVLKALAFGESFTHQFKKLPPFPKGGNVTFFYTVKTIGDLDNRNDTLSNQVLFPTQNALPFVENFETDDLINYHALIKEWSASNYISSRVQVISRNGMKGSAMKFPFSSSDGNQWLATPFIDLKKTGSPYLTFDLAYARIDSFRNNIFKVEISTDCGNTFKPTAYNKSGKALETYTTTEYYSVPREATDWRRDTVDLLPYKDSIVILRFFGMTSDGTPLYVDNVKVEAGFTKDVSLMSRIFPDTMPVCYPFRGVVPVRLAIRNDGVARVDTFKLTYRLNTEGGVSETFIRRLNFRDTAIFTFNQLLKVPTAGNHILTFTLNVNGDENSINDTLISTFRLRPQYAANITEGLESPDFPPLDWTLKKADPYTSVWELVKVVGSRGDSTTAACLSTLYSSTPREPDAVDALTTYPVDLSNLSNPIAVFDLSYMGYTGIIGGGTDTANTFKAYYNDTLRVDISTDCGQTFKPTGYKKWNIALTTALRTYQSLPDYGPRITAATDWRRDTIDLSAYKGGVVQLRFVHIAPTVFVTNTLYLDNFQFVNHESKNLSISNWVTPNDSTILCQEEAFPIEVKLRNEGRATIDSFEIKYQIDNQTEVKAIAQLSIRPNDSKNYRFDNLLRGVKNGEHTLRVIIRAAGDSVSVGDTLFRKIDVKLFNNLPIIETFEGVFTRFPPKDWQIQERNYSFVPNWARASGKDRFNNDTHTATYFSNQFGLTAQDALTSWQVNLRGMKNPYLIFDIAAFRYYLQEGDLFFIEYSTDCGVTYQRTDYRKGTSQVVTDVNPTFGSTKSPNSNQWRSDSVRLIHLKDSLVQFRFSVLKNLGLNIHLDNVRVVELPITKTSDINDTPQYSRVFPNPTTGDLTIELTRDFAQPIDCQLINAQGQIIKQEKIMASNVHNWQLQDVPAGMYFLFIGINNQFEKHKIILIK